MTMYGIPELRICSECSCLVIVEALLSGNTFGAVYWTDGKMEAPMLPDEPSLVKCPHCNALIWLAELEEIEESNEIPAAEYIILTTNDYYLFIDRGISDPKKERYARIHAWWSENDSRRRGNKEKSLAERELRNLLTLADMLDCSIDDQRIMKAEVFRELGLFSEGLRLIPPQYDDSDLSSAEAVIKELCEKKMSYVMTI